MRPILSLVLLVALPQLPPAGTIDTVAGVNLAGSSGDGGLANLARMREPFGVELDGRGRLYVADAADGRIRTVDLASGQIRTVAGDGPGRPVGTPYAVSVEPNGDFYVVDQKSPVVRKVEGGSGRVSDLAGTGVKGFAGDGGPAVSSQLREPNDCCLDGRGGLLIADVADWRVRRVDLKTGVITTFAGIGRPSRRPVDRSRIGDGGPATDAVIVGARAVCVDRAGNTFVCEREGNAIRKIDPRGIIFTVAGTGAEGYSGDNGPALQATFRGPKGLRADPDGNLFVVDTENHAIRKIEIGTGRISTVAGGRKGSEGDGGDARAAGLDRPHGCIVAQDGTLYIADSENHRVRRVSAR